MKYLRGLTFEFEKAIARGWTSHRSAQLNATVKAVREHVQNPNVDKLREICFCYVAWQNEQPAEFKDRGESFKEAFCRELAAEYRSRGIPLEPDFESDGEVGHRDRRIPPPPAVAVNRWTNPRNMKRGAKVAMGAASAGVSVAQNFVTGASAEALIIGGVAAVSATGVGLIVAAAGLTVATSILNASAAWKTSQHINGLQDIYDRRKSLLFADEGNCQQIPGPGIEVKTRASYVEHDMIANHVLPYIIRKKTAKYHHKIVGAVPVIGTAETLRAIGKKAYKSINGTLGANRTNAAGWLACHLIGCDCLLVQAIVAELYSEGEMEWLKEQPFEELIEFLAAKLKST